MLKEKLSVKEKLGIGIIFAITICTIIGFTMQIKKQMESSGTQKTNANLGIGQTNTQEVGENNNTTNIASNQIAENTIVDEKKAKEKNEKEFEKLKKEKKIEVETPTYHIKVNYGAQTVTIYTKDSSGKYTKPVKAMICSTGTYTPTSGTYKTLAKGNWWGLYGDVYGQYATHIVDDILFHSVPYLTKGDRSSLEYWAYDQLGSRVSMGCVRLTVADAKWIYDNCTIGTEVEFYSSSNPGPLGKPSAKQISNAPKNVRGWDPTDPNKDNPWPKYLKSLKEQEEKKKDKDKNKDEQKPSTPKPKPTATPSPKPTPVPTPKPTPLPTPTATPDQGNETEDNSLGNEEERIPDNTDNTDSIMGNE